MRKMTKALAGCLMIFGLLAGFPGPRPIFADAGPGKRASLEDYFRSFAYYPYSLDERDSERFVLFARINEKKVVLLVDTGAMFTLMEDSERVRLNLKPADRAPVGSFIPSSVEGWGYGLKGHGLGTQRMQAVCLPELTVGPQTWHDLYVGVADLDIADLNRGDESKGDVHGLFGAELLVRHGAVIDFSSLTIWLRPDR